MRAITSTGPPAHPGPSPAIPASAANNSGFTSGNPPAPQGTQVAFLQTTGSFSQTRHRLGGRLLRADLQRRPAWQLPGVAAGLPGAGRRRRGRHLHTLGHVVPELTPPPRSPSRPGRTRSNSRAWTVPAVTTPPSSTRSSLASLAADRRRGVRAGAGGCRPFQYRPTGSPWTFAGNSGICGQQQRLHLGQPAGPPGHAGRLPPDNRLVQPGVAGWAAGSYVLTFNAAQRGNYQASRQDFQVLVDGAVVGTFTPSGHVVPELTPPPRSPSPPGRTRSSSRDWTRRR